MFHVVNSEKEWDQYYLRCVQPSIYCSFRYVHAAAKLEPGGAPEMAVYSQGDLFVAHPYVRRPVPRASQVSDLISAFDFGGFWANTQSASKRQSLLNGFSSAFTAYCCSESICTEFIRFHPFSNYDLTGYFDRSFSAHNVIVKLDDQPYDSIVEDFSPVLRWSLRKAERNGLIVRQAHDLNRFTSIYHQNLERLRADAFHFFPVEFLTSIHNYIILFEAYHQSRGTCASHVYLKDQDVLFAFLCHGVIGSLDIRPNDAVYAHVIQWAQQQGFKCLHLGGGQESLLKYKRKFSSQTVPYYIGKTIFRPDLYARLVSMRSTSTAPTPNPFFPAYRNPVPSFALDEAL